MAGFPISPRHARLILQVDDSSLYASFCLSLRNCIRCPQSCFQMLVCTYLFCFCMPSMTCRDQFCLLARRLYWLHVPNFTRVSVFQKSSKLLPFRADMCNIQVASKAKLRKEVLPYAVCLAAAMSVESPFVHLDSIQVHIYPQACLLVIFPIVCQCLQGKRHDVASHSAKHETSGWNPILPACNMHVTHGKL